MRFLFHCFFIFIFVFSFCIFHCAQAQPLPERAPLLGKITTTAGLPIGGATVTVTRQDYQVIGEAAFWGGRLLTGSDGVFSFPEGEEGIYSLSVVAEGYEPFTGTLEWQPNAPLYAIKLLKLTSQRLHILKPDGTPAANVKVVLHWRGQPPGHVSTVYYVTGDDAFLAIPSLTPSQYWLHIVVPDIGYAISPHFFVNENNTQTVEVKLQPGGVIRATAHTAEGKALGGVALGLKELVSDAAAQAEGGMAQGNDGAIYLQTQPRSTLVTQDGSGQMEISDVAPGRYQVRFYLPGEANPLTQTIEVKAGQATEISGVYTLQGNKAPLQLTVQTPDGKPAADREFTVRLQPLRNGNPVAFAAEGPPVPPDVAPTVASLFQSDLQRRIKTDSNGKATLFPLRAGEWQVIVSEDDPTAAAKPRPPAFKVVVGEQGGELTVKLLSPYTGIIMP